MCRVFDLNAASHQSYDASSLVSATTRSLLKLARPG